MLLMNSDSDPIFPMDANERITNRLERMYSLYGEGERFDTVVSVGGHAYRKDIRQAAYRFLNMHLKGDAREVTDSEVDIVSEGGSPGRYPIEPEKLRVFPTDADLPRDELNTTIDEQFVPIAEVPAAQPGKFEEWKKPLLAELKRVTFSHLPAAIPAGKEVRSEMKTVDLESEVGIVNQLWTGEQPDLSGGEILLVVLNPGEILAEMKWVKDVKREQQHAMYLQPRGVGATAWTRKNGPNYVERSHALLGRTVDAGRVWDVIAAAKYLASRHDGMKVRVTGRSAAGLIAAYAAILDDSIDGVTLVDPPKSHMESEAPQFLNVLRVCDVPDALGLAAPRELSIRGGEKEAFERTSAAYEAAGAKGKLSFQ
jgi:hypothetical protein